MKIKTVIPLLDLILIFGQHSSPIKKWRTVVKITFASSLIVVFLIPKNCFSQLSATVAVLNDVSCNTTCDGEAEVTVTNGLPPYTFLWNDPSSQSTSTASNLCPVQFSVIVTDANSDTIVLNDTIKTVTDSYIDSINIISATDTASCNGEIEINTAGPQGTYSYSWSNGDTTKNISGLCPDTYTVTILDNGVCLYSWTGIISYDVPTNVYSWTANVETLHVWPNPATEYINFENKYNKNENRTLTIYSSTGQLIKTIKTNKSITTIDTKDITNGLYFYHVHTTTDKKIIGQGKFILQ